jgi:hypothetical protein
VDLVILGSLSDRCAIEGQCRDWRRSKAPILLALPLRGHPSELAGEFCDMRHGFVVGEVGLTGWSESDFGEIRAELAARRSNEA